MGKDDAGDSGNTGAGTGDQGAGQSNGNAGANPAQGSGDSGSGGSGDSNANKTFTPEELQREIDRAVNNAHKKWKTDLDSAISAKESDLKGQIEALQQRSEDAINRAAFTDAAVEAGITDIKAAWAVARELEYWDRGKGTLDVDSMKKNHPGLFGTVKKSAGVGASGNAGQSGPQTVDDFIRSQAGGANG